MIWNFSSTSNFYHNLTILTILHCCFNAKNVSEFTEQDAYSLEIFDAKDTLTSRLTKTFSNVAYEAPPRETKLIFKTTVGLFYQSGLPKYI